MLLLALLLVPMVLAAEDENIIGNYVVKIKDGTLTTIQPSEKSSPVLNLSSLGLRVLHKGAFDNLTTLKSLNLANNSLSSIPKGLFSGLNDLEHLNLANNNVSDFFKVFTGLGHLKTLNISHNPVQQLREGELHGLPTTCVVFTKGLSLYSISVRIFHRNTDPDYDSPDYDSKVEKEDIIVTSKDGDNSSSPNNEEKNEDITVTSKDDDDEDYYDEVPTRARLYIKVCIEDGVLTLVETTKPNETLPSCCRRIVDAVYMDMLDLSKMGIVEFAKDWSRLNDTSILSYNLTDNLITRITPEMTNNNLHRQFHLARNKIERLEKGVIDNKGILRISLNSNGLTVIEDDALANTDLFDLYLVNNLLNDTRFVASLPSNLRRLHLERNRIAEISPGSFANAKNLKFLDLSGNLIKRLDSDAFRGLENLFSLSLADNRISNMQSGCFQRTPSLYSLRLRNNSIARFDAGVLGRSWILQELDVSYNRLSNITEDFADGLPATLQTLNLDGNGIEKLERGVFAKVPNAHLSLRENRISKIEPGAFDLPNLLSLGLSVNRLGELDVDAFRGLGYILSLSLFENGITKLPERFTRVFDNLRFFDLGNNPIKRLENGALIGLRGGLSNKVFLNGVPIEVVEGGVFGDL